MKINEILDLMQHTPWNFFYMNGTWGAWGGDCDDPKSFEPYNIRREKIDYIGSTINTVPMPGWWVGIDKYDFTHFDKHMSVLLEGHPDRYFVPRLGMEPPLDWDRENPEELCVYWNGPTTAEEIRALVGTEHQDMQGHDGINYPPFPDHRISRQSFSSKVWVKDACKALAELVKHVESSPYADQVIGYMPAFGNCGECMWWGDWRNQGDPRKGDFGISHRKHFYNWAVKKYGSLENLRKEWNIPDLTIDNLPMPTPPERWSEGGKTLRQVLLADDKRQYDCNLFHSDACFDAIEAFGKVIKDISGKAAGAFYGYFQDETVGYAGHLATERAMTTPYVDFYSSPKGYHYCLAGDPGASQAPGQSFARKKLWIEENDSRSHHASDLARKNKTADDTETAFWREIYRALVYKQGFWWMDIGGLNDDWYADERMVEMFRHQADFYKKWSKIERNNIAEVLFVEDEESCAHTTYLSSPQRNLRLRLERELRHCGAAVDHLRISDIFEVDMSKYKFIVFCHAFVLPEELWNKIKERIRPDAHVLFNYAAGLLAPEFSYENQHTVTGFRVQESGKRLQHRDIYKHIYWHCTHHCPKDYPLLHIVAEKGQEVLQTSPDGYILTARIKRGEGKNIFSSEFTLRTPIIRKLLEDAKVNFLAPEYCSVHADDKLIGFFPHYDCHFDYDFNGKWRDVITGEIVSGKTTLSIPEKRFRIFEKI